MKNFPSIKICLQEHTNYYPGQLMIMNTTTLPLFFYHIQPTTMPDLSFSIPFQAVIGTSLSAHCLAGNGAFLFVIQALYVQAQDNLSSHPLLQSLLKSKRISCIFSENYLQYFIVSILESTAPYLTLATLFTPLTSNPHSLWKELHYLFPKDISQSTSPYEDNPSESSLPVLSKWLESEFRKISDSTIPETSFESFSRELQDSEREIRRKVVTNSFSLPVHSVTLGKWQVCDSRFVPPSTNTAEIESFTNTTQDLRIPLQSSRPTPTIPTLTNILQSISSSPLIADNYTVRVFLTIQWASGETSPILFTGDALAEEQRRRHRKEEKDCQNRLIELTRKKLLSLTTKAERAAEDLVMGVNRRKQDRGRRGEKGNVLDDQLGEFKMPLSGIPSDLVLPLFPSLLPHIDTFFFFPLPYSALPT